MQSAEIPVTTAVTTYTDLWSVSGETCTLASGAGSFNVSNRAHAHKKQHAHQPGSDVDADRLLRHAFGESNHVFTGAVFR